MQLFQRGQAAQFGHTLRASHHHGACALRHPKGCVTQVVPRCSSTFSAITSCPSEASGPWLKTARSVGKWNVSKVCFFGESCRPQPFLAKSDDVRYVSFLQLHVLLLLLSSESGCFWVQQTSGTPMAGALPLSHQGAAKKT